MLGFVWGFIVGVFVTVLVVLILATIGAPPDDDNEDADGENVEIPVPEADETPEEDTWGRMTADALDEDPLGECDICGSRSRRANTESLCVGCAHRAGYYD